MTINDEVELLVRETLDAAVKQDRERFSRALESTLNEDLARQARQRVVTVITFLLVSEYDGGPTDESTRRIAAGAARTGAWCGLSADDYAETIAAMLDGRAANLEPSALAAAPFTPAEYLLGTGRDDGFWWSNYLDRAESVDSVESE